MKAQLGYLPSTHLEENHSERTVVFDTYELETAYASPEYAPLNRMVAFDVVFYILITTSDSNDIWNAIDEDIDDQTSTHELALIHNSIHAFGCCFQDWLQKTMGNNQTNYYEVIKTNGSNVVTKASCNTETVSGPPGLF